jgi:hypothetical protein
VDEGHLQIQLGKLRLAVAAQVFTLKQRAIWKSSIRLLQELLELLGDWGRA